MLVINLVLLAILGLSLATFKKSDWISGLRSPLFLAPAAFFAFYLLSMLWTTDTASGWRNIETKMGFLFITYVIASTRPRLTSTVQDKVLRWFVAGNVSVLILALAIATYYLISTGSFTRPSPGGTFRENYFTYKALAEAFMHPGYLATYFGFAFFAGVYLYRKKNEKHRKLFIAAALFMFAGIVLLQGRINLIALVLVIGVAAVVIVVRTRAYKWLLVPLVPLALLAALFILGPKSIKARYLQLPDFSYDISGTDFNSATYRLAEWTGAWKVVEDHPLAGAGVGDKMPALLEAYREVQFYEGLKERFNAHNQYMESLIATGITGLALLLVIISVYAVMSFKSHDWLSLAALAFFCTCMLTESMLERAWAVLLFTLYFSFQIRKRDQGV